MAGTADNSARFHRLEGESKDQAVDIARMDTKLDSLIGSIDRMQVSVHDAAKTSADSLSAITRLLQAQDARILQVEETTAAVRKAGGWFAAKVVPLLLAVVAGAVASPGAIQILQLLIGG